MKKSTYMIIGEVALIFGLFAAFILASTQSTSDPEYSEDNDVDLESVTVSDGVLENYTVAPGDFESIDMVFSSDHHDRFDSDDYYSLYLKACYIEFSDKVDKPCYRIRNFENWRIDVSVENESLVFRLTALEEHMGWDDKPVINIMLPSEFHISRLYSEVEARNFRVRNARFDNLTMIVTDEIGFDNVECDSIYICNPYETFGFTTLRLTDSHLACAVIGGEMTDVSITGAKGRVDNVYWTNIEENFGNRAPHLDLSGLGSLGHVDVVPGRMVELSMKVSEADFSEIYPDNENI